MKNKNKEVAYNPSVLMKNYIISQVLFLYITLMIGDTVRVLFEFEFAELLTRYLPIVVVTFVSAFVILKKNISNCLVKDKEEVKRKVIIAPIIVAVILFGYGLYSVESNMSSIKSDMRYSYYSLYMSSSEIERELDNAASEARVNWLITSIVYLAVAECVAFMANKKLDEWLRAEELTEETENNLVSDTTLNVEKTEEVIENDESSLSNIKWDL